MDVVKGRLRISVRQLVEFILRSGDIDNRHRASSENAMQEGGRIHRMIQRRMDSTYQAEVMLKYSVITEDYELSIEGRADGIIDVDEGVTIDEIKGTYKELFLIKEPVPVHLAQAKCYAYMYSRGKNLKKISIRMTYCHMETEEIKYFVEEYPMVEIKRWFEELIASYQKWADYEYQWKKLRNQSITQMAFPFEYREGQKELVTYVYQTMFHKKKLFLEAPTGVGKTISTVFPAIKALEKGMGEKIFYLTAKTITRTVADNTFSILREKGLHFKSIVLTAKDKICFMEEVKCNPDACPYAKGHLDRINEAMYDMLTHEESLSRELIEQYAHKHQVCPFEFALDLSLFADGIIGDYNYLFDPHVYLKRFFGENKNQEYLFLIDEAHNLLERGREMYSATLIKEEFLNLKREIKRHVEKAGKEIFYAKGYAARIEKLLEKCNRQMLSLKRECEGWAFIGSMDGLVAQILRLNSVLEEYWEEADDGIDELKELLRDLFFKLNHFLVIYELLDDKYVKYGQILEDGSFLLKLFCVDPSTNLKECMDRGRSSILFSATFLPIQYYKKLLGGSDEDYEVYAKSIFDTNKRALLIAKDVTSKYTRRSEKEFLKIAEYIEEIVKNRHGNYMVFCPSYAFMQVIYDIYTEHFGSEERECIIQSGYMDESEREEFLKRFEGNEDCDLEGILGMEIEEAPDSSLIGFCVLGGIFSEGIDLKNDSLIGAIIVGTGLPQVCLEREILKNYFDEHSENGFDYAYRYPGMNKVLQAAGRVIRTEEDTGIIALLDERFLEYSYQKMFPREWESFEVLGVREIARKVERFWDEWL